MEHTQVVGGTAAAPPRPSLVGQWLRGRAVYAAGPAVILLLDAAIALHGRPAAGQVRYGSQFFWDSQFYIAMSRLPVSVPMNCIGGPYCWRVLTPWLIHLLPGPPSITFQLVAVASLVLTCLVVSWIALLLGLGRGSAAWAGLAFATLGPATGFGLYDYALVDPLALLLLGLLVACTLRGMQRSAAVALVLLALAKEIVLIGIAFRLRSAVSQRAHFAWAIGAAVVALAVSIGLRVAIRVPPGDTYGIVQQLGNGVRAAVTWPTAVPALLAVTAGTWGLLLPLAVLQFAHPPRLWRRPEFFYIWLLATAHLFLNAQPRVVVYGFAAVVPAAALEVRYLSQRLRLPEWRLWAVVIVFQVLWSIRSDLGAYAPPETLWSDPLTTALDALVLLVTVVAWVRLRRLAPPGQPAGAAPQSTAPGPAPPG